MKKEALLMTNGEAIKRYNLVSIMQPVGLVGIVLLLLSFIGDSVNYLSLTISLVMVCSAIIAIYRFSLVRKAAQE